MQVLELWEHLCNHKDMYRYWDGRGKERVGQLSGRNEEEECMDNMCGYTCRWVY